MYVDCCRRRRRRCFFCCGCYCCCYFCYCQSHSLNRWSVGPSVSCFAHTINICFSQMFCYALRMLSYTVAHAHMHTHIQNEFSAPNASIPNTIDNKVMSQHLTHRPTNDISCVHFHNFTCVIQRK